jgi:uncharacterized membrane protein
MEEGFKHFVSTISLAVETIAALMISLGAIEAIYGVVIVYLKKGGSRSGLRDVWIHFGVWLMLGLEFELAADIVRTAIAPTWTDIGQLASIGAIRTFLNYFLERDIDALRTKREGEAISAIPASE